MHDVIPMHVNKNGRDKNFSVKHFSVKHSSVKLYNNGAAIYLNSVYSMILPIGIERLCSSLVSARL